jgi:glycosyltransferase involved in cell wall biosynthesis
VSPRLRILYLCPSLIQGGAERHVVELVRNLDPARFEAAVCIVRSDAHYRQELPVGEPRFVLGRRMFSPWALAGIVKTLRAYQPDVLHAHLNDCNLLARVATWFAKVPAVVTSVHYDDMSRVYRLVERLLWRRSDRVVGVSRGAGIFLTERLGIPVARVQVIVNGVDPALFVPGDAAAQAAARRQLDLPADALVALMPARISRQKNQALVVEAMARLQAAGRLPARFRLVLAGRTSSQAIQRKINRLVRKHGLAENVRQLGPVKDMRSLYWATDVVLMPSQSEGSSLAAFEAMSAGLPLLASDRGNSDGAVVDGVHGWVVPADDLDALVRALDHLLAQPPETLRRIGAAGRARVQRDFTAQRVARDFAALYESLAARHLAA